MAGATITEEKGVFSVSGELNRDTVTRFWPNCQQDLLVSSNNGDTIVLNLAGIEDSDTAGLAWLLNLMRDSKKQNISFTIENLPDTISKLAKISDVEGFLPLQ